MSCNVEVIKTHHGIVNPPNQNCLLKNLISYLVILHMVRFESPKPISEFFMDKDNEIIFITEFVEEERENLVRMHLDFNEERRCCGLPPVKKEMVEKWIDYLEKHGYMLIAKHKNKVIGHIAAVPENSTAEIAIFVHQDYEGKRIGSELIRFMKNSLEKANIKKLVAVTRRSE